MKIADRNKKIVETREGEVYWKYLYTYDVIRTYDGKEYSYEIDNVKNATEPDRDIEDAIFREIEGAAIRHAQENWKV